MARIGQVLVLFCLFQIMWSKSVEIQKKPISKECREQNICENVDDYPRDLARKLISELINKGVSFGKEELAPEISQRSGSDFGFPLCNYTTKTISPEQLGNEYGQPELILNDDENPIYTFITQLCQGTHPIIGSNSTDGSSPFVGNYPAVCIQRFKLRQLYFINQQNGSSIGYFKIPTTCVCGLK